MPRKKILYGYQPESTCVSAWLFVIFPFQSCPTREPAVDAAAPLAMPAQACRGFHQHVPGLVTVDAAGPFAVAAADFFVSRIFLFCHSSHGTVGRRGVKHLQKGQEWRAVFLHSGTPGQPCREKGGKGLRTAGTLTRGNRIYLQGSCRLHRQWPGVSSPGNSTYHSLPLRPRGLLECL